MSGPIALHGGGEFQAGDEPFLRRVLELATAVGGEPVRVVLVPTAAARGRPHLVGAHGTEAFERVAAMASPEPIEIVVEVVSVVDATSATDPASASRLAAADLIHLPGGDPDLIPSILRGTSAWDAILAAHARGAVLAGASAGAMALAPWTWTPGGGIQGLGLVPGSRRGPARGCVDLGPGARTVPARGPGRARGARGRRADRRDLETGRTGCLGRRR